MVSAKTKEGNIFVRTAAFFKSKAFQRAVIVVVTVTAAFFIVHSGTAPKKYKLELGKVSKYTILAPRDVVNEIKSRQNAEKAASALPEVMSEITGASVDMLNGIYGFFRYLKEGRDALDSGSRGGNAGAGTEIYEVNRFLRRVEELGVPLSDEQAAYLLLRTGADELNRFENAVVGLISEAVKKDITKDNLAESVIGFQNRLQSVSLNQELKNIGASVIKAVLKPNKSVDTKATEERRNEILNDPKYKEIVAKGKPVIYAGDTVTEEKYRMLEELNLLEESGFDFVLAGGLLMIILLLTALLLLYMRSFCGQVLQKRDELVLLAAIILFTLLLARLINEYSALAIPVFIAPMLIAILIDLKLAIMVNLVLAVAISFITKGNLDFLFITVISGSFGAFLVHKANQRSTLSIAGLLVGLLNLFITVCFGAIEKMEVRAIFTEGLIVFVNGLASMVLTIGLLPFLESIFNVITPLKLLELANPNQPLMKRMLLEAPGTYHHSLMVGNLAEVATEAIGGNSLLARVGAYYHDTGKLRRPNFFKENQLSDNPHDRMTANLSTLVITSHVREGVEIAKKYKIPQVIRDIIRQHHGNTLVAYFYHKARKDERGDEVSEDNFRYDGPKPASKEAAVVMLADSVEAAVRSMVDKTEGKIEGLVRKIIKERLDDGQLDMCDLTLKDLDKIAKAFMKVFSGYFHEREEYPEEKEKKKTEAPPEENRERENREAKREPGKVNAARQE